MYKPTIGLEIHLELNTKSKIFSSASNIYSDNPNSNVSVIDLGFPGILPVLNKEVVKKALKIALSLNCIINKEVEFDRKNYYYPDLPKGYQITQFFHPIGINGKFNYYCNEKILSADIHDIHIEEDTAKLTHEMHHTIIDYNRCGVPLVEIVTEPCFHSVEEVISFLESLRNLVLYTDTSDARTDRGELRVDVNVSVSKTELLGTKVEIKNINSFASVAEAIKSEISRQINALEINEVIVQETRRFDSTTLKTESMREKVDAVDYKYFTEPNIPSFILDDEYINKVKSLIPELPFERTKKYIEEYKLSYKDSLNLIKDRNVSDYFEKVVNKINPIVASNYISSNIISYLNKCNISINEIFLTPDMFINLLNKLNDGKISSKQVKDLILRSLEEKVDPNQIIESENLIQNSNEEEILVLIKEVINENPEVVNQYKSGKSNMSNYLVGQVMKKTGGKVNPLLARDLMLKELEIL